MDKVFSAADKVLTLIPFNGNKTVIGAGLKVLLPVVVTMFPWMLFIAPVVDAFADCLVATGLAHKMLKKNQEKK